MIKHCASTKTTARERPGPTQGCARPKVCLQEHTLHMQSCSARHKVNSVWGVRPRAPRCPERVSLGSSPSKGRSQDWDGPRSISERPFPSEALENPRSCCSSRCRWTSQVDTAGKLELTPLAPPKIRAKLVDALPAERLRRTQTARAAPLRRDAPESSEALGDGRRCTRLGDSPALRFARRQSPPQCVCSACGRSLGRRTTSSLPGRLRSAPLSWLSRLARAAPAALRPHAPRTTSPPWGYDVHSACARPPCNGPPGRRLRARAARGSWRRKSALTRTRPPQERARAPPIAAGCTGSGPLTRLDPSHTLPQKSDPRTTRPLPEGRRRSRMRQDIRPTTSQSVVRPSCTTRRTGLGGFSSKLPRRSRI